MLRITRLSFVGALVMIGCSQDPPCAAGELGAAWQAPPLAGLVSSGAHVCQLPEAERATHAQVWIEDATVHDTNMANVDRAQGAGWERNSDNWYGTSGDFESPKWSELSNDSGRLRIDVRESNGGALVDYVFTPHGAQAAR